MPDPTEATDKPPYLTRQELDAAARRYAAGGLPDTTDTTPQLTPGEWSTLLVNARRKAAEEARSAVRRDLLAADMLSAARRAAEKRERAEAEAQSHGADAAAIATAKPADRSFERKLGTAFDIIGYAFLFGSYFASSRGRHRAAVACAFTAGTFHGASAAMSDRFAAAIAEIRNR